MHGAQYYQRVVTTRGVQPLLKQRSKLLELIYSICYVIGINLLTQSFILSELIYLPVYFCKFAPRSNHFYQYYYRIIVEMVYRVRPRSFPHAKPQMLIASPKRGCNNWREQLLLLNLA